jgi:thioredoxin 1
VQEFTVDNFDALVLESEKPVVIDFWAEWCGPCKALGPVIDQIADERPDIVVGKVDIDSNQALAMRFGISSIPFVAKFENGKIVSQAVGLQPKASLERALGLSE